MEKQPNSEVCFMCGRENELGLQAQYYTDAKNQQVVADITIPSRFNGWPGHAHGGIVAALLDEAAFRAIWIDGKLDRSMVTANLKVKMLRPAPTEKPLRTVGWIVEIDEKHATVASEIRMPDGTLIARGEAHLVNAPATFVGEKEWDIVKNGWKIDV